MNHDNVSMASMDTGRLLDLFTPPAQVLAVPP